MNHKYLPVLLVIIVFFTCTAFWISSASAAAPTLHPSTSSSIQPVASNGGCNDDGTVAACISENSTPTIIGAGESDSSLKNCQITLYVTDDTSNQTVNSTQNGCDAGKVITLGVTPTAGHTYHSAAVLVVNGTSYDSVSSPQLTA